MPNECIDCIVTSPPYYGLRDYGVAGQLGLERGLEEYHNKMLAITAELKRVLKPTGTMWWNHGDSYSTHQKGQKLSLEDTDSSKDYRRHNYGKRGGLPDKCLILQAHRLAIRMIDQQGWILRNAIIWHKPNCMPSSVRDRFTVDFETVFFFTKSAKYWFERQFEPQQTKPFAPRLSRHKAWDNDPTLQRGRGENSVMRYNPLGRTKRCVWRITTSPYQGAHFATFPPDLIETPIKAGCPEMICNKCGTAREMLYEVGKQHSIGATSGEYWIERNFTGDNTVRNLSQKIGHSDCGCNAGWHPGIVLDPFMGSGTTAVVAVQLNRHYLGIELNPEYVAIAERRIEETIVGEQLALTNLQ